MATTIRPEVSEKNKYYIDKHRHYELKHFCLQYPIWKREYSSCCDIGPNLSRFEQLYSNGGKSDPTLSWVLRREEYSKKIELVEKAAKETDYILYKYILKGVTEGLSYTYLKSVLRIPCSKDTYYNRYRKFFWLLSEMKG